MEKSVTVRTIDKGPGLETKSANNIQTNNLQRANANRTLIPSQSDRDVDSILEKNKKISVRSR